MKKSQVTSYKSQAASRKRQATSGEPPEEFTEIFAAPPESAILRAEAKLHRSLTAAKSEAILYGQLEHQTVATLYLAMRNKMVVGVDFGINEDTFIQLKVNASVREEGQRIVVALSDQAASSGPFTSTSNAIQVPEFISRKVDTTVWVRHGQVLLLGGLYRNTKNKSLTTLPWLTQGENLALGALNNMIPLVAVGASPVSSVFGNRLDEEGRRELVFLIKAELWKDVYAIDTGLDFGEEIDDTPKSITGVISEITEIPQSLTELPSDIVGEITEGFTGEEEEEGSIEESLRGGTE